MTGIRIDLDWTRLLGFDQANPGPDPFRHSPKIGPKEARGFGRATPKTDTDPSRLAGSLRAKVGTKDRLGR